MFVIGYLIRVISFDGVAKLGGELASEIQFLGTFVIKAILA